MMHVVRGDDEKTWKTAQRDILSMRDQATPKGMKPDGEKTFEIAYAAKARDWHDMNIKGMTTATGAMELTKEVHALRKLAVLDELVQQFAQAIPGAEMDGELLISNALEAANRRINRVQEAQAADDALLVDLKGDARGQDRYVADLLNEVRSKFPGVSGQAQNR